MILGQLTMHTVLYNPHIMHIFVKETDEVHLVKKRNPILFQVMKHSVAHTVVMTPV